MGDSAELWGGRFESALEAGQALWTPTSSSEGEEPSDAKHPGLQSHIPRLMSREEKQHLFETVASSLEVRAEFGCNGGVRMNDLRVFIPPVLWDDLHWRRKLKKRLSHASKAVAGSALPATFADKSAGAPRRFEDRAESGTAPEPRSGEQCQLGPHMSKMHLFNEVMRSLGVKVLGRDGLTIEDLRPQIPAAMCEDEYLMQKLREHLSLPAAERAQRAQRTQRAQGAQRAQRAEMAKMAARLPLGTAEEEADEIVYRWQG